MAARRGRGEDAARGGDGEAEQARFVRLAVELGSCMSFEPKRWRDVFERSAKEVGRGCGLGVEENAGRGGEARGRGVKTRGRRLLTHKMLRAAQPRGELTRRPSSRGEADEVLVCLPPVLVEQYLDQPAMVGELMQELHEGAHDASNDNQDVSQGADEVIVTTNRSDDVVSGGNDGGGGVEATEADSGGATLSTGSLAVKLPVLSTIPPSVRRGMSRLPSPTREVMEQIHELEQLTDQNHSVEGLYRSLKRQHQQEKREAVGPRVIPSVRRKAVVKSGPLTALAGTSSVVKLQSSPSRLHIDTGEGETAPQQHEQMQPRKKSSSEHNPSNIERCKMSAEDRDVSDTVADRPEMPLTSKTDTVAWKTVSSIHQINSFPFEISDYHALKSKQRQAIKSERKVDEQVKHTIAEVRRLLPLDVIYEFGLGKFASPAQQRATELICRVGIKMQHGLLVHAMDRWKWWLDKTVEGEQIKSSVCLQCWWRRVSAVKELLRRRRVRLELQRRQLALLQHLASKQQQAALQITRFFRRCACTQVAQQRERELQAAVTIQSFWRKSSESWLALRRHMRKQQQIQAAVCIQRYARGMFARRRRRLLAKISRVSQRQNASNAAKTKRAQATRTLGAAITIQQGFREWNRRRVAALQRRRVAFEKDKRTIIKVQSFYRGQQARRFTQKHRVAVASAILVLQCWWRCCIAQAAMKQRRDALRSRRQQIRDQIRDAKRSAFSSVLGIKQKWTRLASTGEPVVVAKDGKQYSASDTHAAARIQGFWRGRMTRQRLKYQNAREAELTRRKRQRRLYAAAVCIQKRIRGIQGRVRAWRHLENVSARRIQSFWRGVQTRWQLLQARNAVKAVAKMQARWRSRRNTEARRLRARAVIKIQALARKFLGKRWLCTMVRRRQFLAEEQEMGRRLMEATKTRIKDELLLQSFAYKKLVMADGKGLRDAGEGDDYADRIDMRVDRSLYHIDLGKRIWKRRGYDGVWQEVFRNASGNNLEIDNSHFARFLKLLPHSFIHKTQFPAQKADLCFAKMKEPKTKAISFSRFNKAILMVLREKFAAPTTNVDTKRLEKSGKEGVNARTSMDGGTSSSSPAAGEPASTVEVDHENFLRFMKRYVLPSAIQDGKYRKMLEVACTRRLVWAVEVLRRFAAQIESRKKHNHFMVVYRERQVIKFENQRATMIQKCFRKHKFRRELKAMLGAMFIEFIDFQGHAVQFKHIATGKTVSKRPVFLKGVPCGKTIPLPFPGEEFRAFCERHEDSSRMDKAPAEVYCVECEDVMCRICFARDHAKRHALQQHRVHPIQLCTHCGIETATRECLQCGNGKVPYCDCCFPLVHNQLLKRQNEAPVEANTSPSSETTAKHRYRTLVVMCVECTERVAQWKCDVCHDVFCKRCLISFHAKGMRQFHEFHRLSYFSVLREQAEEKRAEDAEKLREKRHKQMEEDVRRREAQLAKQNSSATLIQSVVRSFLVRRQGKAYMKLVRQTHVARSQRQKDDAIRATMLYKVRSAFGLAPALKSDTATEVAARRQRLAAIKRTLLLENLLLSNQSDRTGANSQRRRRWTKKQRARAEHAARAWCAYDGRVRIRKGEWRNHIATIVSTQSLMLSGRVLVFVELPKRSVVLNWEWLEPYDDDEILRQPYEPPHKALADLSRDFQAKLSRVVERAARLARLLYLQTIEFNDIVQYAWVVEFNKLEQQPEYWNVVLNKRTVKVPKAMQLIERMEPEEREKLDVRVALAKNKLEMLLHPFQPRDKPKVAQRRNAVVHVVVRGSKDAEDDLGDGTKAKIAALRESMLAIDSARFWHESVETNPKLSASRSAAAKFAAACAQPPQSSHVCWSLVKTLQWMDLHAADGFEATAKTFLALSTELQLFVAGELARSLEANGEDAKDALQAFQQLLRLKEETLHLLLSKHEEAAETEREAIVAPT